MHSFSACLTQVCAGKSCEGAAYSLFYFSCSKLQSYITCTVKGKFISKLSIVVEEADESAFWLELITDFDLMKKSRVNSLLKEANELTAIFVASRKTMSTRK